MPLQSTSGSASYDAFGGGVAAVPKYIEDYFSTFLYSATGATQNIVNNIDLSTKGGLVWIKDRTLAYNNCLFDTSRGVGKTLYSNTTNAQVTDTPSLTNFNTNGFSLGADSTFGYVNNAGNLVSWSIAKAPKFFDVVTYTGNGTAGRQIAHNLGSVPGCIIIKRTDSTSDWPVYHAGFFPYADQSAFLLNSSASTTTGYWNNTLPTSTVFSVSSNSAVNASGGTYVAYLFANQAGGFGLTGSDSVVACGAATGGSTVTLGWEPQWILLKTKSAANWKIYDTMRGMPVISGGSSLALYPNTSDAESNADNIYPTATGFTVENLSGIDYLYVAIRRGPMKVPTSGTSVFSPVLRTGTSAAANVSTGNTPDWVIIKQQLGSSGNAYSRLQGPNRQLYTESTLFEVDQGVGYGVTSFLNTSFNLGLSANGENQSGRSLINWTFSRAPSFFDEVCYTGTGTYGAANHNLGVTPELVIYKSRSNAVNWGVIKPVSSIAYYDGLLNLNSAFTYYSNDPSVAGLYTSTQFCKYQDTSGYTYVAYLFATCAGVSKVGSYTGNGSSQTINCGFTGGARFVMVKATSTTGNWIVADSARGIVAGNDPALYLNSTAAEVTGLDWIDADNSGFVVNETATIAANTNEVSYIFFAVA